MIKKNISRDYRKYKTKNIISKLLIKNYQRNIVNMLKDLKFNKILDVGCGGGFTTSYIKKRIDVEIVGVDIEKETIEKAKKKNPEIKFYQSNAYNLKFKSSSFPLVICNEVLEHVEKPKKVLKELRRVTAKYCLISTPNEPFFSLANFIRGRLKNFGKDYEHLHFWSKKKFLDLIKPYFKIKKFKQIFPWNIALCEK